MNHLTSEVLCALAQGGDMAARDLLVTRNQPFIHWCANDEYSAIEKSGLSIDHDDLVQEGSIGLMAAIRHYDSSKNKNFLSYAETVIKNAMTDLVRRANRQCEQRLLDKFSFQRIYLDATLKDDEERMLRIESIVDPFTQSPEQIYIKKETIRELYAALDKLEPRQREYLLYRFGFDDGEEHTTKDTAVHFRLKTPRAKSLEKQALQILRENYSGNQVDNLQRM